MDANNQNTTANTNTDSAAPDFGGPVGADKPSLDMDAINEAIAAEGGKDPNLQNTFDVGDISLDDVPQSQDELDKRMKEDPEMSLAGGSSDTDAPTTAVDLTSQNNSAADPLAAGAEKEESAPAASFVDGDIIDETAETSAPETSTPSYDNINTDPLTNFETGAADSEVAQSLGDPAEPATANADADAAADTPAPAGEPAHIADTITMPAQKSKKPIVIGVCAALLIVVIVVLMILTASK